MRRERTGPGGLLLKLLGLALLGAALMMAAFRAPERSLESLVARWAPPPSDFIELGDQLVHLRDEGPSDDPQPIVLIHGTAASLHTWEGWTAELKQRRRVISFDLPGFGLSGAQPQGDYSDEAYIAFVLALLDHLKLPSVVLAGNSLGGQIAWQLAAQAPQRVAALVLIDAAGHDFKPDSVPLAFQLARLPVLRGLVSGLLPRRLVEASVANLYGDPAKVDTALVDRYFELTLREGNRAALLQRIQQMRPGQNTARLAELKQSTLILWGGRDRLIPPAYGQAFADAIDGSRLVVFEALGHVPQEEDPAATVAVMQDFLHSLKP